MGTLKIDRTGEGLDARDTVVTVDVDETVVDQTAAAALTGEVIADLPGCFQQPDGSVVMMLAYPFAIKTKDAYGVVKEQQHATIQLHRLKGEHLIRMRAASGEAANVVALACALRLPDMIAKAFYDKMDAADLDLATEVIENFTRRGPTTGR